VLYAGPVAKQAKKSTTAEKTGKTKKAGKSKKTAKGGDDKNERVIADNRKARHNYLVLDTLECGIQLVGSEVKSLRIGGLSLDEAYGRIDKDEVWLINANIAEYKYSHGLNHEPKRRRKLLMHRREMNKFAAQALEKGNTLVPLKMYFKEGRAKVLLGVCRGKQQHDKRQAMKQRESKRDMERAMRRK
jgi:SsrA-binding protein